MRFNLTLVCIPFGNLPYQGARKFPKFVIDTSHSGLHLHLVLEALPRWPLDMQVRWAAP